MLSSINRAVHLLLLFLISWMLKGSVDAEETVGCGNPRTPKRGYRIGTDFTIGATVEYFCDPGFRIVRGTRLRKCSVNGKWTGTLPKCRDVNECLEYRDLASGAFTNDVQLEGGNFCNPHAQCINSIGSYMCKCNAGYHGDGRKCNPKNVYGLSKALMKRKLRLSSYACGTLGNTSRVRRIVGGTIAGQGAWPWQAAIYYRDENSGYLFNGALIRTRWVVTVANILLPRGRPIKPRKLQVTLGEFNRERFDGTEKFIRVKRIIIHPGYSRTNHSNNIALLELAKPVKPNNFIRMVCIPRRKRDSRFERPPNYGTVAGWGTTRKIRLGHMVGPLSAKLLQVTVPLVSNRECERSSIYSYDSSLTLCAGFRKKPKDPCFGDIGSPLVIKNPRTGRWVVIGLFGWSEGCGMPRKYAYYTRVSKYRRWILSIVRRRRN